MTETRDVLIAARAAGTEAAGPLPRVTAAGHGLPAWRHRVPTDVTPPRRPSHPHSPCESPRERSTSRTAVLRAGRRTPITEPPWDAERLKSPCTAPVPSR